MQLVFYIDFIFLYFLFLCTIFYEYIIIVCLGGTVVISYNKRSRDQLPAIPLSHGYYYSQVVHTHVPLYSWKGGYWPHGK